MLKVFKYGKNIDITCFLCETQQVEFDVKFEAASGKYKSLNICKECFKKLKEKFANIEIK